MNFEDVKTAIESDIFDTNKFMKLERKADKQVTYVKQEVKDITMKLEEDKYISLNDKTLISGLNANNQPKRAPEYQPESPYAYPLFKTHNLSKEDIEKKRIPPNRSVHASKYGSLYRVEKWYSLYLTEISRAFCKEEFLLDTSELLKNLERLNELQVLENENASLFTLDVEKLYLSIQPELALQAIHDALNADETTHNLTKTAIEKFIKLSFDNAYVAYKDECFKCEIGIPTGGSLSRQIADIFLHWILFIKMTPKLSVIQAM